ncbi:MAG: hypothetical protein HYV97_00480 [Bdellovibrio sp.]|nr:hypothetical protein [Bdellovibrio sp.]
MKTNYLILAFFISFYVHAETPILKYRLSPSKPVTGQTAKLFVTMETNFESDREVAPVLLSKLDGVEVVNISPFSGTWTINIPSFNSPSGHTLSFDFFLEDKERAGTLRASITQLTQEILSLNEAIAFEHDPDTLSQLILERDAKVTEKTTFEAELVLVKTKIRSEEFNFAVASNLPLDLLYRNIVKAQGRNLLIQNNDGGWDYFVSPDALRDRTEASYANQFGLHAQSQLDAYFVTNNAQNLQSADKTAVKLYNDPVGVKVDARAARCTRGYATDHEFLSQAGTLLFPTYFTKGQTHFSTEKNCFAALAFLNTTNQNDPLIDTTPQADLDNMTNAQRVAAFTARLIAAGRNAGLRAYDWNQRLRVALIFNDRPYARAIADRLAQDAVSITINADYYLLGLANTISSLVPFASEEPSFQAILNDLKTKLFAQQKIEGRFIVEASEGVEAGIVQDQAFILKALLDLGESVRTKQLVDFLLSAQQNNGAYRWFWELGDDSEFVEGNSELLTSMAQAFTANSGMTNLTPWPSNYVLAREKRVWTAARAQMFQ